MARSGGSALAAALVARRGARERAERELVQRLGDVRQAEGALVAAEAGVQEARDEADRVWCDAVDPTRLQLLRAGAQDAVESATRRFQAAERALESAREHAVRARELLAGASADEEAVARLIERKAGEDALVARRRAEEDG